MSSSPLTATLAWVEDETGRRRLCRNRHGVLAEAGGLTAEEARQAALDFLAAQGHQDPELAVTLLVGHYLRACGRVRGYRYNALLKSKLEESDPWLPAFIQTRSTAETAALTENAFGRYAGQYDISQKTRRFMQRLREALRTLFLPSLNDEGPRARPTRRARHMGLHGSGRSRGAGPPSSEPSSQPLDEVGAASMRPALTAALEVEATDRCAGGYCGSSVFVRSVKVRRAALRDW